MTQANSPWPAHLWTHTGLEDRRRVHGPVRLGDNGIRALPRSPAHPDPVPVKAMAIRGPVFKSASNAIKGHDSCHCVAVPERRGTVFTPPAHYAGWEREYTDATKALNAEDEQVNLKNVMRQFRQNDAALQDVS